VVDEQVLEVGPAVMCIAETNTIPSAMPASSTAACTSSVIRISSRRSVVLKVM
jgi:hypothetical protein